MVIEMEKVYVIGHLTPDTDTTVAAMSMAAFLNLRDKTDRYVPAMTGNANTETEFVFKKFNVKLPIEMADATGKKLYLVDHNEASQIVHGWAPENILGFVDHHKIKFECPGPIEITARTWGSVNTIIYDLYKKEGIGVPEMLKPLMLCALLSDTVITKSPTTTPRDIEAVEELADELNLNYKELGMEMFKAKAQVANKSAEEIIRNDYKEFDFNNKKCGVGQIETPDLKELEHKYKQIAEKMKQMKEIHGYHSIVLMLTDIIEEGSRLMVVSDEEEKIARIFGAKIENHLTDFIPGIMSRKKQVAAKLAEKL